jgi:competence ComEA-like helix-hairpin-helix protein
MSSLKSFFSFTRREQYGLMVLLSLILITIVVNFFISESPPSFANENAFSQWEAEVRAFQERQEIAAKYNDSLRMARRQYGNYNDYDYKTANTRFYEKYQKSEKKFPDPFPFDPNNIGKDDYVKLGFSEKQAESIVKYREKGAVFKSKQDFQKVFVVSDEMYAHLEDYVMLPDDGTVLSVESAAQESIIVELNTADTMSLQQIKRIGSYLAKRIVDYRQKLGGFHSVEQLLDINGIDEDRFAGIAPYIMVDKGKITKLDLNKNSFKDFTRHPYFEYYIVKAIFEYNVKHGLFSAVDDIRKIPLIYDDLYNKINPYLYVSVN